MKLYLLRHGIAEDGGPGMRDEDRKLTAEGRRKLREVLKVAREAGVYPSLILASPLLRALETADLAKEELKYSGEIISTESLVPEAEPRRAWEEVRVHRTESDVLLASHNPLCASLAGFLLGAPDLLVDYKKAALMRIDIDSFGPQPRGILRWFMAPSLAR